MTTLEEKFLEEAERFRLWAAAVDPKTKFAEWESEYTEWGSVYVAVIQFLRIIEPEKLESTTVDSLLAIVDGDNEAEFVSQSIAEYPETLLRLAKASIESDYVNARWEFARCLGELEVYNDEAEGILVALAQDENEYVRRRALGALAEMGSPLTHTFIGPAWESGHEYQRMMVLSALYKLQSPNLERYLTLAELDGREYLVAFAAKVRSGEVR